MRESVLSSSGKKIASRANMLFGDYPRADQLRRWAGQLKQHTLDYLGAFIVQLDDDHPSHIVTPIIHRNRRQVAKTFEDHSLGEYNEDPETITRRARNHLRRKYLQSTGTITGANVVSAESGRIALVTNEGNSRFGLAGAKVHVAVVGIEKLIPRDEDLAVMLNLLARSSTGQHLTVYTEFISGPGGQVCFRVEIGLNAYRSG